MNPERITIAASTPFQGSYPLPRPSLTTPDEDEALRLFGQRLRLARLRRGLTQADIAGRAGITRKTCVALESGAPGTSLGVVAKVLGVLGYIDRLGSMLEADPLGVDGELGGTLRRPRSHIRKSHGLEG